MKRTRILAAAALLFLVLLLIGIACTQSRTFSYQPYEGELEDGQYVPNNFQQEAAIWLGVYKGQLYIWPRCSRSTSETEYNGWLCALTPEGIVKIKKLDRSDNAHEKIAGFDGRFLYYWHVSDNELYSYDIETDQEEMIATANSSLSYAVVFAEDGSLYIPSDTPQDFVHVRDGKLVSYTDEQAQYSSGELSYYLRKQDSAGAVELIVSDADAQEQKIELPYMRNRSVFPCSQGILVHDDRFSKLLYLVRSTDEVVCLMDVPCEFSHSAATVVGDDAFLSVKRYQGYKYNILPQRYENDEIEGTYRINLATQTTEKVSDSIFSGLYYFGGEHIFATDEHCNITVLDLEGNVVQKVLELK